MYKYVDRVGVELEGGYWLWQEPLLRKQKMTRPLKQLTKISTDASVRCGGREIKVGPFYPHMRRRWRAIMRRMWPQRVDESCGMHVHVSLKTPQMMDVLRMRHRQLWRHLKRELSKKKFAEVPHLHYRLSGRNSFCRTAITDPRDQYDRYHALNWGAYYDHGTLEVRVLPQTEDIKTGIALIETVVAVIEKQVDLGMGGVV